MYDYMSRFIFLKMPHAICVQMSQIQLATIEFCDEFFHPFSMLYYVTFDLKYENWRWQTVECFSY